jgi:hypothetical protein
MISELLLALSGIPGDIIAHQPYQSSSAPDRFVISSRAMESGIVSQCERDLLEKRLLPIAHAACVLKRFVEREEEKRRSASSFVSSSSSCAYRRAVVTAVDRMVLQPYESRLCHLEQKILKGSIEPNANAIEEFLGEFSASLIGVKEALKRVMLEDGEGEEDDGFYGAKLLDELAFRYRQCGCFETKNALRVVRRFAMRAFYGHCFAWLAFGSVVEEKCFGTLRESNEGMRRRKGSFFIGAVREEDVMTRRLERLEMNKDDEDDDMKEEEMKYTDEHQSRYFQDDDYLENAKILPSDGGAAAWRDAFAVKIEQTPKRMSASDAEAVHFVGRCVRALRLHRRALELRRRKKFGSIKDTNARKADIDAFLDKHARETGKDIESLVLGIRDESTTASESEPIDINDGEDDFDDFASLAVVVSRAKERVSKKLGEVIDSETYDVNGTFASSSFVMETFASLRNFFLLQRGDIFASLLDDENSIFIVPESEKSGTNSAKSTKKRIETAWEDAVADNTYDGASERFSLKRGDKFLEQPNSMSSYDGFDDVYMSYERAWPVGLLVTDFALEKYGALFKSLFRLRRARSALSRVWQNISRQNRSTVAILRNNNSDGNDYESNANGIILRARTAIDFALRNWEQYASEDVIAHRWSSFTQSISPSTSDENTAADFEKATKAHREFIVSVSRELFVKDGVFTRKKKKDASDVEKAVAEISNLAFALELLSREYRDINSKENGEEASDEQKLRANEHLVTKTEHVLSRAQECSALLCAALRSDVLGISDIALQDKVDALLFRLEFNKAQ